MRLTVGAVNIVSGNSTCFDNLHMKIRAEHVMASGALPPAFAPVQIEGEYYWEILPRRGGGTLASGAR